MCKQTKKRFLDIMWFQTMIGSFVACLAYGHAVSTYTALRCIYEKLRQRYLFLTRCITESPTGSALWYCLGIFNGPCGFSLANSNTCLLLIINFFIKATYLLFMWSLKIKPRKMWNSRPSANHGNEIFNSRYSEGLNDDIPKLHYGYFSNVYLMQPNTRWRLGGGG